MRPLSPRNFPDSVTVKPLNASTQDAAGGRVKSWGSGVDTMASVQLLDPLRRGFYQGATVSDADGMALFASDPGVKVDYQIVWHLPGLDRLFSCLGQATPEGGRNAVYSVLIKEIK